jgi:HEXXH motif-containing protein
MQALDAVSAIIASFTRRFTMVANLLIDEEAGFSSGSTNEYVGRSIFWNAHRESVDTGALAEALVHEAIHSLLSMTQVVDPWFVSNDWLSRTATIESPWTGAKLRIEPFLQACFVWFGLAHFWATSQHSNCFTAQCMETGLARCRQGFLKGSLSSRMGEYLPDVAPDLVKVIGDMQDRIAAGVEANPSSARSLTV